MHSYIVDSTVDCLLHRSPQVSSLSNLDMPWNLGRPLVTELAIPFHKTLDRLMENFLPWIMDHKR